MERKRSFTSLLIVVFAMVFLVSLVAQLAAEEYSDTITGRITEGGILVTDFGEEYVLSGNKAYEVLPDVNKRIEIKGNVMERAGQTIIDVQSYEFKEGTEVEDSWEESWDLWWS
jgi:hypothetical protein